MVKSGRSRDLLMDRTINVASRDALHRVTNQCSQVSIIIISKDITSPSLILFSSIQLLTVIVSCTPC